jgi:hypothetical protein
MKIAIRTGLAAKRYVNIQSGHYVVKVGKILPLYDMLTPGDDKINKQKPEFAEIMLFLRRHLLSYNKNMFEAFKYMTIYYEYKDKGICFMHLKDNYVYLCFNNGPKLKHPKLAADGRKAFKAFKCFVNKDIDVKSLNEILKMACAVIDKKLKI